MRKLLLRIVGALSSPEKLQLRLDRRYEKLQILRGKIASATDALTIGTLVRTVHSTIDEAFNLCPGSPDNRNRLLEFLAAIEALCDERLRNMRRELEAAIARLP